MTGQPLLTAPAPARQHQFIFAAPVTSRKFSVSIDDLLYCRDYSSERINQFLKDIF